MNREVIDNRSLLAAFANCEDGDTITIHRSYYYSVTPQEPLVATMGPYGGAPLVLDGKKDVTVQGVGMPTIASTQHGSILARRNCERCHVRGIRFVGNRYITVTNTAAERTYYFAPVLYIRSQACHTTDCIVEDSGDQGIAELHFDGAEGSDYCEISRNVIRRCGNVKHPTLAGDGAGIAFGNSYCDITENVIEDCLRGIELETDNRGHPTNGNVIADNVILRSIWQALIVIVQHGDAGLFGNNEICRNIIQGRGGPHPQFPQWGKQEHGLVITGGHHFFVHHNNISTLNDWWGIEAQAGKADLYDSVFSDNTIFNCGRGNIWGTYLAPYQFKNNVIKHAGGKVFYNGWLSDR